MDVEKNKRRQSLKIIISEAIMVLAVILTVVVLAFVVSGYWVNSDFKVERQGMIQVSSIPTGATLEIDGESPWLQRTNMSKVLTSGEHTIVITKEGYDSWTKTVNISEGLLYRVNYPRLFLKKREPKKVFNASGFTVATSSPDRTKLLLINETTNWTLLNLNEETFKPKKINVADYFASTSSTKKEQVGVFTDKILDVNWDKNGSHALFKIDKGESFEWVLLDINNIENSINLTREFSTNFEDIEILDNSSNNLLAIRSGNLHKIDTSGKVISSVLVENVLNFDHFENEVVFIAKDEPEKYYVGLIRVGDNEITKLEAVNKPSKVAISKFYDEKYITVLEENKLSLFKEKNFEEMSDFEISFTPESLKVGRNGEFIIMRAGSKIASLDMESNTVREWEIDGEDYGWIDGYMVYSVANGELNVYDYDGLNHRVLAKNVSSHFPAMITGDKWLYYFSDGDLIRETIIEN